MAEDPRARLRGLDQAREALNGRRLPPVETWNPPLSGVMDLVIERSGTWMHEGREIQRAELVRLFSTILRREDDGDFYLVTPVEKWRIAVEDAPFLAVAANATGDRGNRTVEIVTNCGDQVIIGTDHAVLFDDHAGFCPRVHVRHGLEARATRAVAMEIADLLESGEGEHAGEIGLWSGGRFWPAAFKDHA